MKNTKQSLPGIKRIDYVLAENLTPNVMLNAICGGLVSVLAQTTEVPFVGEAICVTTSECDNHGKVESVTLTFSSTEYVPSSMPLAFIVTDVNGNSFLIGSREKPFPIIKHDITFGSPAGDQSVNQYEVKYVAIRALIGCVTSG